MEENKKLDNEELKEISGGDGLFTDDKWGSILCSGGKHDLIETNCSRRNFDNNMIVWEIREMKCSRCGKYVWQKRKAGGKWYEISRDQFLADFRSR